MIVVVFFLNVIFHTVKSIKHFIYFKGELFIYVGAGIGGLVLIIFGVILYCRCKKKRTFEKSISRNELTANECSNLPNSFSNLNLENDVPVSKGPLVKTKPTPLKIPGNSNYVAKPYGEIGEFATSAFITGSNHNKRLASITTISSSQSISSMAQVVNELRRGSSPVSPVSPNMERSEERRDSGYVDVNIPTKAELAERRSSELKAKGQKPAMKKPINMSQQIHLKQRRTSQIPSDTDRNNYFVQRRSRQVPPETDNEGYLTPVFKARKHKSGLTEPEELDDENTIYRHATTGQAMEYCRKAKHALSKKGKNCDNNEPNESNYGNTIVYSPSNDSLSSSGYTDLEVFQKTEYTEIDNSQQLAPADKGFKRDNSDYEIPHNIQPKQGVEGSGDYANLNAKDDIDYQNFDYSIPNLNPTSTDKEDVYVEFLTEAIDEVTEM